MQISSSHTEAPMASVSVARRDGEPRPASVAAPAPSVEQAAFRVRLGQGAQMIKGARILALRCARTPDLGDAA